MRARLLVAGAALIAFGASLGAGFHFDDYAIFADPVLKSPSGWLGVWSLARTRPLTYFTFWLNYWLGGQDPLGYHLFNLALHIGAAVVLYECLRRMIAERIALLAAILFAIHPVQAEAVNYVWARSIVLAALLCFASLHSWLNGRRWAALAWFAAGLLAKEECAALPLVLLLLSAQHRSLAVAAPGGGKIAFPLSRDRKGAVWVPLAAMCALSVASAARVVYATAVTPGAPAGLQAPISPAKYLLAQGPVILRYLRLLIVPYGFTVDPDIAVSPLSIGLAAWMALGALAWIAWRYLRPAGAWFIGGIILLLPSSSIFPAADLAADRRLYLPMFAFAAGAALLLARLKSNAALVAIGVALAAVSVHRTVIWMNDASLWREAVERAPRKVRPKIQLARALPAGQALELLNRARELAPADPTIPAEIGKTLLAEGQPEAALLEFGRALALAPRDALNLNNRGVALAAIGQTEAARADFERALQMDPALEEARENLRKLRTR